jgi:hypothetical protein
MKKKFLAIFSAFLASMLLTTSALAGGAVKLSSATFSLGSLIAKGTLLGLGNSNTYVVVLEASGPADITCINSGTNRVPGQSSPRISAIGQQLLSRDNGQLRNGKSDFDVETAPPEPVIWFEAGCPNANWVGQVDFVYWNEATIRVINTATQDVLLEAPFVCTTTRVPASVSCSSVP